MTPDFRSAPPVGVAEAVCFDILGTYLSKIFVVVDKSPSTQNTYTTCTTSKTEAVLPGGFSMMVPLPKDILRTCLLYAKDLSRYYF